MSPQHGLRDPVLLQVEQAKDLLEVDYTEDDRWLRELINEVESTLEGYLGTPFLNTAYVEKYSGGPHRIFLRHFPVKAASLSIVDTQGTIDDADDETKAPELYRVNLDRGKVVRTSSIGAALTWEPGVDRWEITYEAGWENHSEWIRVAGEFRGTIRQLVARAYEHRATGLEAEGEGGGISRRWDVDEHINFEIRTVWDRYARIT